MYLLSIRLNAKTDVAASIGSSGASGAKWGKVGQVGQSGASGASGASGSKWVKVGHNDPLAPLGQVYVPLWITYMCMPNFKCRCT